MALFRGINVGAANRLPMAELRSTMASLGYESVVTYIQSGNVLFGAADDLSGPTLAARIEREVADRHAVEVSVVLRTVDEIRRICGAHPDVDSGLDPKFLHVVFLDRAPAGAVVESLDPARFEPDSWTVDGREIYVRYPNGSARSKLNVDVFERAFEVTATARNLNTVRKLADLVDPADRG